MPRKLYDENGDEVEVLTDEEINALKANETKVSELQKQVEELSADEGNRNWKQIRETLAQTKALLKEKGVEVDETGKPAPKTGFTEEDISNLVKKEANKMFVDRELGMALKTLDADKQAVVKSYFGKLTAGEELNPENVGQFIEGSLRAALPGQDINPITRAIASGSGSGTPTGEGGGSKFSETAEGKNLASELGMTLEEPAK